jgi:hypothetical protein
MLDVRYEIHAHRIHVKIMDSAHHQEEVVHTVVLDHLYVNVNQDLQDRDANRKVNNLYKKYKESFLFSLFLFVIY